MLERFAGRERQRETERDGKKTRKKLSGRGRLSDLLSDFRFVTVTLGQLRQNAAIDHPLNFEQFARMSFQHIAVQSHIYIIVFNYG